MIRIWLKYISGSLLMTITCLSPLFASEAPDKPHTASISIGAEYASGTYGTGSPIRSVYMPLIATWSATDRLDIGIELPFLYQSNSNVTVDLYRNSQQSSATAAAVAKGGPGGGRALQQQGAGGSSVSGSSGSAVSGVGDILLRLGFIALFEERMIPQIRPSLIIKFPTAKRSDGLGTGEFDAGVAVEATKWFGALRLTGEGVYTFQGRADGFGLNNYFSYSGGIGYQLTENIEPMVMVKGATAPSDYSGDLLELRARVIWSVTRSTTIDLYGSCGIAESSPEYGGGIAAIYSF